MRKLTSILTIAFLAISVSLCAQNAKKGKALVAYFSASGNTEAAAKKIQEAAGADLYKIEPEKPYTKEDLDFRNRQARSVVEMGNPSFREKLGGKPVDIKKYDVIYLGFPIWANKAPSIIYSFLESQDHIRQQPHRQLGQPAQSRLPRIDHSIRQANEQRNRCRHQGLCGEINNLKNLILMRKIIRLMAFAATMLLASPAGAQDSQIFNHLSIGAEVGTTGWGFEAAVPLTHFVTFRTGFTTLPRFDVKFDINYTTKGQEKNVDVRGRVHMTDFKLLADIYPFKHSSFHLTGGFYA